MYSQPKDGEVFPIKPDFVLHELWTETLGHCSKTNKDFGCSPVQNVLGKAARVKGISHTVVRSAALKGSKQITKSSFLWRFRQLHPTA